MKDKASNQTGWKCFLEREDSEILWGYGAILKEQGRIKKQTLYAITKYILTLAVSDLKEIYTKEKRKKELLNMPEYKRLKELERRGKI